MSFTITYRERSAGPLFQHNGWKEETTVTADGFIDARRFHRHGAKGRFHITERATAQTSSEDAEKLYVELMDLIIDHDDVALIVDDTAREVSLHDYGLKITIDGGLSRGGKTAIDIMHGFLASIELDWKPIP